MVIKIKNSNPEYDDPTPAPMHILCDQDDIRYNAEPTSVCGPARNLKFRNLVSIIYLTFKVQCLVAAALPLAFNCTWPNLIFHPRPIVQRLADSDSLQR